MATQSERSRMGWVVWCTRTLQDCPDSGTPAQEVGQAMRPSEVVSVHFRDTSLALQQD
jgi:hypothetical protein